MMEKPSQIIVPLTVLSAINLIDGASFSFPPNSKICDKYEFYDHGTRACESCRDLCDNAAIKTTTTQCWEQCKAYAEVLWPPDPPNPVTPKPGGPSSNTDNGFPLGAKIIIPFGFALILLVVGFVFYQRFRSTRKHASPGDQEVIQMNTQQPGEGEEERELATDEREEEERDMPFLTTSTTSQSGIQEEGTPDFAAPGAQTFHILQRNEEGVVKGNVQGLPVPVTKEGHKASSQMVFPESSPPCIPGATAGLTDLSGGARGRSPADLDSTDPKTMLHGDRHCTC